MCRRQAWSAYEENLTLADYERHFNPAGLGSILAGISRRSRRVQGLVRWWLLLSL
jgi:hypothetical protein